MIAATEKQELLDLYADAVAWSNSDTWQIHNFANDVIELVDRLLAECDETA